MEDENSISPVAQRIIEKCGGVAQVSAITGRTSASIYKWMWTKEKGGTGGLVPAAAQQKIMEARQRGEVSVEPADFFDFGTPAVDFKA